jgi:hypothetical protein
MHRGRSALSNEHQIPASGDKSELLIAGDSHIISFGIPLKSEDNTHYASNLTRHGDDVLGLVGAWPRQFETYWASAQEHAKGRTIAVFWGGNVHLAHYLFAPTPLFDFVTSANPDLPLDETAVIVPEEAIRVFFSGPIQLLKGRVDALSSTAMKVLVPGTPPPKEDDMFIRERLDKEPHFSRAAAQLGLKAAEVPLSPPILRLKLWMVLQGLLRDMAEETGAVFVPVPVTAQTGPGFLHTSYYANDVTHANLAYGDMMLAELRKQTAPGTTVLKQ